MEESNSIEIVLKLNGQQRGAFVIDHGHERLAEMVIGITGGNLTVYHTHVSDKLKGQGIGTKLLNAMVAYARKNGLRVIPLCTYVSGQFKRHPDQYADIWNQHWHG